MTDHTPTPWKYEPWHIQEGPSAVLAPEGWIICTTSSDENAAFIVKAVNAHDALVKAVESALLIAKREWDFPGAHPHRAAVVRDMEDALALVSRSQETASD